MEAAGMSSGSDANRLVELLLEQPYRFEFFQAVRILEQEAVRRAHAEGSPLPAAVGGMEQGGAVRSGIRFRSAATLQFPPAAIMRAWQTGTEEAARPGAGLPHVTELELSCFGLVGPSGTLPPHYTSLVVERFRRHRDSTLREFLDIFLQRFAALHYRAWWKYRHDIRYEQAKVACRGVAWDAADEPRDAITSVVSSLVGLAGKGLTGRLAVDDEAIFHYSSHFSRGPRTAACLEDVLADLLNARVRVEQFVGRWLELEAADQTMLASQSAPEGQHARLGHGALLGKRVWDIESTFEVVVGPLKAGVFRRYLPGSHGLAAISDFLRLYAGPNYEILIRLAILASEVPPCRLGGDAERPAGGLGPRLGWTTWLVPPAGSAVDRHDTTFSITR
jgi:type VI secretion system protein ImpH